MLVKALFRIILIFSMRAMSKTLATVGSNNSGNL
jgi:hypothetical protein